MTTRRDFLKTSAALAALGMLPNGLASCTAAAKEKQIGMQLYSVMELVDKDFEGTVAQLVTIGIKRFEAFGYRDGRFFGKTPAEMKAFLGGLGAQMTSSHSGMRFLGAANADSQEDWDKWKRNCSDTAEVGSGWVIQAGYPNREVAQLDDVRRLAEQFNKCGEIAKTYGLQFAFHNHLDELKPLDGQIPYELLLNNTDKELVAYQMDTGYMETAYGADFLSLIRKYPGRFSNFHLRDVDATGEGTDLGKGVTDFKALFELADVAGMKEYYIEQGHASLESMKNNYDFIMQAAYIKQ